MKEIDWAKINYELSEPFPLEVVNIRQTGSEGFKKVYAAYIDARDVQDRLDEVVGPDKLS